MNANYFYDLMNQAALYGGEYVELLTNAEDDLYIMKIKRPGMEADLDGVAFIGAALHLHCYMSLGEGVVCITKNHMEKCHAMLLRLGGEECAMDDIMRCVEADERRLERLGWRKPAV